MHRPIQVKEGAEGRLVLPDTRRGLPTKRSSTTSSLARATVRRDFRPWPDMQNATAPTPDLRACFYHVPFRTVAAAHTSAPPM